MQFQPCKILKIMLRLSSITIVEASLTLILEVKLISLFFKKCTLLLKHMFISQDKYYLMQQKLKTTYMLEASQLNFRLH